MRLIGITLISFLCAQEVFSSGNGMGSGDGFPLIQFQERLIKNVPAKEELNTIIYSLGKEFPTLAYKLLELSHRFEKSPTYMMLHLLGDYPYELANSKSSDELDTDGFPRYARVVVWNDFFKLQPQMQAKVLLHEWLHILIAKDNEDFAQKLTDAIFTSNCVGTTYCKSAVPEKSSYYEKVLSVYLKSQDLKQPCDDMPQVDQVYIHGEKLVFPLSMKNLQQKITQDLFFIEYRNVCLRKSLEGQAILSGFWNHPVLHELFIKNILKSKSPLKFSFNASEKITTSFYNDLYKKINSISQLNFNQLLELVPELAGWALIREQFLTSDELSRPLYYTVSEVLRFPIAFDNLSLENLIKIFKNNSDVSYNDWPSLKLLPVPMPYKALRNSNE